jgi:hypothetical protein
MSKNEQVSQAEQLAQYLEALAAAVRRAEIGEKLSTMLLSASYDRRSRGIIVRNEWLSSVITDNPA